MVTLPLKCKCGTVRGLAEFPKKSDINRFVCFCGDCQTFPQFLGNQEVVLDRNGGTEIIPAFHRRMRFTSGLEQLKSVRLSSDGLLRWYAACCKTPIGNSMTQKMPYLGLVHTLIDVPDREAAFGPVVERIYGAHGIGELPRGTHQKASFGFLAYVVQFIVKGFWFGRGGATPFFLPSGQPVSKPLILSDEEYIRLRAKTGSPWNSK